MLALVRQSARPAIPAEIAATRLVIAPGVAGLTPSSRMPDGLRDLLR